MKEKDGQRTEDVARKNSLLAYVADCERAWARSMYGVCVCDRLLLVARVRDWASRPGYFSS